VERNVRQHRCWEKTAPIDHIRCGALLLHWQKGACYVPTSVFDNNARARAKPVKLLVQWKPFSVMRPACKLDLNPQREVQTVQHCTNKGLASCYAVTL